jgi:uncharacterized protein
VPARVWTALAGLTVVLLIAVAGLDQWQARHGEESLLDLVWAMARRQPARSQGAASAASRPDAPRIALVVDGLGDRHEVLESLRGIGRPVALAILPSRPASVAIAREAARAGLEVLLDLPMEPYRYPEVDPGPGALLMVMPLPELTRVTGRHLDAVPGAVGVTNYMGSRMTEDRGRMRAVLEAIAARRLFLVDDYASSLSVASDEAKALGIRTARRRIAIGELRDGTVDRAGWDSVATLAERRGEAVVIAHGDALPPGLAAQYASRWESRGMRLVRVSELAR